MLRVRGIRFLSKNKGTFPIISGLPFFCFCYPWRLSKVCWWHWASDLFIAVDCHYTSKLCSLLSNVFTIVRSLDINITYLYRAKSKRNMLWGSWKCTGRENDRPHYKTLKWKTSWRDKFCVYVSNMKCI